MRTSCLAFFSAFTGKTSLRERESASRLWRGLFTNKAERFGRNRSPIAARRFISQLLQSGQRQIRCWKSLEQMHEAKRDGNFTGGRRSRRCGTHNAVAAEARATREDC